MIHSKHKLNLNPWMMKFHKTMAKQKVQFNKIKKVNSTNIKLKNRKKKVNNRKKKLKNRNKNLKNRKKKLKNINIKPQL